MPNYRYEAMDSSGNEVVDVIEAEDAKTARKLLAARGYFVTKLTALDPESTDDKSQKSAHEAVRDSAVTRRQADEPTGCVVIVCLIFGIAGIASLVYGLVLLSASAHLLFTGEKAIGVVTKLTPYRDTTGNQVRGLELPTVTFQSADGPVAIHTQVASNRFRLGDKVTVLHPLKNPRSGQIFMALDMFAPGALFFAGGVLGNGLAWLFGIRPALLERRQKQAR